MPTYEYRCKQCGKVFDPILSAARRESGTKPPCPKCKSRRVEKVLSRFLAVTEKKS